MFSIRPADRITARKGAWDNPVGVGALARRQAAASSKRPPPSLAGQGPHRQEARLGNPWQFAAYAGDLDVFADVPGGERDHAGVAGFRKDWPGGPPLPSGSRTAR